MRKLSIQFLIFLLVFSTFPANYNAATYVEEIETEQYIILLAEEVDGKIDLLDLDSLEVVYEIEDDSEALYIEAVDEEYVIIQLTTTNEDEQEVVMEGMVRIETVFNEEEADEYREARETIEEDGSSLVDEADEIDENLSGESTEDDEIEVEEATKESNEETDIESLEESYESNISSFSLLSKALVAKESATSRLGHIRNRDVTIYKELGGSSFKAGAEYTNAVYYIKRQAVVGQETYYLLSTRPSATQGVVGWANSRDLSTHPHVGVDKKPKIFSIKGNGKGTSKAWGGSKDTIHASLANLKGKALHVNLTEKVGNNTWYRGKIDGKGPNVWVHSSYVEAAKESATSRLGHIRSGNVQLYKELGGQSFTAGSTYTNAVYYIKRQALVGNETYYLLSTSPSATKGVVGWANSRDLSTHPHVGVDKKPKIFSIKGNGKGTSKAWGGSKDTIHASLANLKGKALHVNLTEKVGNNTWYRGKIDGKGPNVWVHSSYVVDADISRTSRLGHIRRANVDIYESLGGSSFKAGSTYTNAVYYIKSEANFKGQKYYLLSTSPSATRGVVGWAKASDLSTHTHVGVDKRSKAFAIKGTGKAYSKAWGGSKDLIHADMQRYESQIFYINLTEKVGNNTWYRGKINNEGQTVWLHSSYLTSTHTTYTNYMTSFTEALNIQMSGSPPPQTDKYRNLPAYVHKDYLTLQKGTEYKVTTAILNVREQPNTSSHIWGQLKENDIVTVVNASGNWYEINYGNWRNAKSQDVSQYLDPSRNDIYQHLVLSQSVGVPASEINKVLSGKGVLNGQGQAFINGAKTHSVNEIYLISHALLESGHGTSKLSNGVEVGKDKTGKLVLKTEKNKNELTEIKTTYNMFGIGAVDADPLRGGAIRAYEEGWFTPNNAIVGGAKFIGERYIHNQYKQNTLYKMRWNPASPGYPQYATDIGWAVKQTNNIKSMYSQLENPVLTFDIPKYR